MKAHLVLLLVLVLSACSYEGPESSGGAEVRGAGLEPGEIVPHLQEILSRPGAVLLPSLARTADANDSQITVTLVDAPTPTAYLRTLADAENIPFVGISGQNPSELCGTSGMNDVSYALHSGLDESVARASFLAALAEPQRAEVEAILTTNLLHFGWFHVDDIGSDLRGVDLYLVKTQGMAQAILIRISYAHA